MALGRDRLTAEPNGSSHSLPTHSENSQRNSLTAAPKAAWDRFNGYGRKRIGFLQSVKAVVFSSCASRVLLRSLPFFQFILDSQT